MIPQDSPADLLRCSDRLDQITARFRHLDATDYADYLALKDQEAKYRKADEILGKIWLMVMADLGIRNGGAQALGSATSSPTTSDTASPQPSSSVSPSLSATSTSTPLPASTPGTAETSTITWHQNEKKLEEVSSDKEARDFLESVAIKDIAGELRGASWTISEERFQKLTGTYSGEIVFDDKAKANWLIEWEIQGQIEEGNPKGTGNITLTNTKDGKTFSRSTNRGTLKFMGSFTNGQSQSILINSYNDDGYIQLYLAKRMDRLIGNYYLRKGPVDFEKVGTVSLIRKK